MRTITQSGVRGEVVYYAPCNKPFRQYPDIMRQYLEKNGITEVSRDNFSFSSKIPIGDYIDSGTQIRHSEGEIRDKIRQIREQKGYKPQRRHEDGRDVLEIEAEAILRRLEAEEEAEKARQDLMTQLEEQHTQSLHSHQPALTSYPCFPETSPAPDKPLFYPCSTPAPFTKQGVGQGVWWETGVDRGEVPLYLQELSKQREMLYTLELERERRRYHGVLVRALEGRKRHEERERRREEMKEEKRATRERKREERLQARELNQLLKEVKEDMELTDHVPLPDLHSDHRVEHSVHPNEIHMESLPSIQSLQMALLNDTESEEELLSVLSHLLVCAIEDPGIPSAHRHTTILGQTLNRADITHANISEILRVYLNANAMGEVRVIYGLMGTEKERRENPNEGRSGRCD
ncbi:Bromodomain adjacent to zinc finger domain protein 2B [Chionoecetes opilio]|uniref:Bromodomain adjacent to zinc finger domain protein 2B n=1 Tax=Chionoecetes opilio TaxID=41210 RepID=A0A8J4Y0T4_CHIOP|nr:Bromodomain adjacent to zinc finger domain protein 2B [Chionoecetes opilio]